VTLKWQESNIVVNFVGDVDDKVDQGGRIQADG
jgi:hypothetical protein